VDDHSPSLDSHQHAAISRRTALQVLGSWPVAAALPGLAIARPDTPGRRTGMGLVLYDCNLRRRWLRQHDPHVDLFEPLLFLQHCHALGAGGMQAKLGVMRPAEIGRLRDLAERHDLFIEAIISPPEDQEDLHRFESEIRTARDVGALAARTTIIPGRRYERFDSLAEFREFERRARDMLERAAPVVEEHRVPLAVENHKDQRIDERLALLEHLGSEYIGACVDTGNSFALLDGASEAVEALAPYAFSVHLKDQALQEYADGFWLGDIPLGQGSFDLARMVTGLQQAKPTLRFSLELITRDALKVPCLTERYWAPMPAVPASDLARTLRFVREHAARELQQVSTLPLDQQAQLEQANLLASIEYASDTLGI
jgi:sugar phosphate isomerase/epimerase